MQPQSSGGGGSSVPQQQQVTSQQQPTQTASRIIPQAQSQINNNNGQNQQCDIVQGRVMIEQIMILVIYVLQLLMKINKIENLVVIIHQK